MADPATSQLSGTVQQARFTSLTSIKDFLKRYPLSPSKQPNLSNENTVVPGDCHLML